MERQGCLYLTAARCHDELEFGHVQEKNALCKVMLRWHPKKTISINMHGTNMHRTIGFQSPSGLVPSRSGLSRLPALQVMQ